MKFFSLPKILQSKQDRFASIEGYEDIKEITGRALDAEENYNLLFYGAPASAKTLFLQGIGGEYFDGSNTTNKILDILEEKRPKIICIDELDKMGKSWQNQLLNFMESGRIKVVQQKKSYDFEIKGPRCLLPAMNYQGSQNLYNQGSEFCNYLIIQKISSLMLVLKCSRIFQTHLRDISDM